MKQRFAIFVAAGAALMLQPPGALACSVCYGEPDSPASRGLTWAIFALGAVVVSVLAGAVSFFVQAGHKAAVIETARAAAPLIEK